MSGASFAGTLNEKAIVMASRSEKSTKLGSGTGRGLPVPNIRAKLRSLIRPNDIFAVDVAMNFSVPLVTVLMSAPVRTALAVSMVLAVMYVPKYVIYINANGFEKKNRWGFVKMVLRELVALSSTDFVFPDAFSMMLLSIKQITGAISIVAAPALATSAPTLCSNLELPVTRGAGDSGDGSDVVLVGFSMTGGVLANGKGFGGTDMVCQLTNRGWVCWDGRFSCRGWFALSQAYIWKKSGDKTLTRKSCTDQALVFSPRYFSGCAISGW